jgi:hypothetical protein
MTAHYAQGGVWGWAPSRTDWLLIRRDWILNRVYVLPSVFVFATFQVLFVQVPLDLPYIWVFLTCVWIAFLALPPLLREMKAEGSAWSCTLPLSRRDLVKARYIGGWLLVAAAYLVALAVALLAPGSEVSLRFATDLDTLLIGATIVSVILVLLLPSVIGFGVKGMLVLLVPLNIVIPVLFVVSKATGTQDSLEGNLLTGLQVFATFMTGIRDGLSRPLYYAAVVVLLFAINWASYRAAVALFLRRDL